MASSKALIRDVVDRLLHDPGYYDWFLEDPDAALAEFPGLKGADIRLLKREAADRERLVKFAERLNITVRSMDMPAGGMEEMVFEEEAMIEEMPAELVEMEESEMEFADVAEEGLLEEAPPAIAEGDAAVESAPAASGRLVNTGFSQPSTAAEPVSPQRPLQPNRDYYFWLEVGARIRGSIETSSVPLPVEKLPPEARLQVVLFSFAGQIGLVPGADVGELQIDPYGRIHVAKPVPFHQPDDIAAEMRGKRLFFPVTTPAAAGEHRLRCNIYHERTLVQSRLITVLVSADDAERPEAVLASDLDYNLSRNLNGRQLAGMGQNKLSIMLNDNGNGTHGFRFFGENEFKNDAEFGESELVDLLNTARAGLRKVAWGDDRPYAPGKKYRLAGPLNKNRLRGDLITLALRGFRFYDTLINRLAGDIDRAWDLADLMLTTGQVQIASKKNANLVIPAALFYDHPLDDGVPVNQLTVCADFLAALDGEAPLVESACFQGKCAHYDDDKVICPSGFWGFRHNLGLPVTVDEAPDTPVEIPGGDGPPSLAVSVSTDPNFVERPGHEQRLQGMGFGWEHADERDESIDLMKKSSAQVVYFYCHGGLHDNLPYLSVGPPGSARITPSVFRRKRIRWRRVRPLVFINGCHTTQLTPERALNLVNGFVENAAAAGVIGTEITIFEPIAVQFGEAFFRRFLIEKESVGEAVRGARLEMLKSGNPLGLVYIPYALPGLRLA
jgi:hypothetical protein